MLLNWLTKNFVSISINSRIYSALGYNVFKFMENYLKGQMNKNFDIRSLASLKQLNTKTDHYKVYSPKNFAS